MTDCLAEKKSELRGSSDSLQQSHVKIAVFLAKGPSNV